ncbi:MAG: septation protein SepH [Microbacterium sp.]
MEQLKVIGTEDETLVLATESGETYALPLDEALRAQVRRARRDRDPEVRTAKPSPREIQAHIRAGLSAQEVAELLGARAEDVARYEGPVLAEREHVVGQALAVPVLVAGDLEHDGMPSFGAAIRAKLAEAGAAGERWTSWKDATGWVVKLEFRIGDVDRDARWDFDPKRSTLSPSNAEAVQLSRQGSLPEGLIPRLRALDAPPVKDDSRFDSGAFGPRRLPEPVADLEDLPLSEPVTAAVRDAAIKRAPDSSATSAETADLLEALRRRRGQREPLPGAQAGADVAHAPLALFDALEPGYDELPRDERDADELLAPAHASAGDGVRRKGRPTMPSWDEIVFGARNED